MSRQIDITSKLSKDEREYLAARGLDHILAANEEHLATAKSEGQKADEKTNVSVTIKSLTEQIEQRNEGREDDDKIVIPAKPSKDGLLELIKADDEKAAAKAAAESGSEGQQPS